MRRSNRITMVGTLPPLKGISPYCEKLILELSKKYSVEFINFKFLYPDFIYPGGTRVSDPNYYTPKIQNITIRNIISWYNPLSWIKAGLILSSEIIHLQWWSHVLALIYFVILSISKLRNKKIIITVHNVFPHEMNWFSYFLNRIILIFGDIFIVHSKELAEKLSKLYSINKTNIDLIPHGILKPSNFKGISKEEAKNYLNIPHSSKIILFFGNIRDYKGIDVLLQALKKIKDKMDNVILVIAGQPWIDMRPYEEIIKYNNLEKNIIKNLNFISPGYVEYYFSASDLVILPYKYFDSQSGVGTLALFFEKPLIVTNVGGLPDLVRDDRAIARPNDSFDLSSKIIKILQKPELIDKLSNDSKEIKKKYSWEKIMEMHTRTYSKLCS